MKKVKIITIYDQDNYGNRLQNYAVQTLLTKLGFDVKTVKSEYFSTLKRQILWPIYRWLKNLKEIACGNRRRKNFLLFNNRYINSTILYYNNQKCYNFFADYYITGSDQIWNPKCNRMGKLDLLYDYKKEKCISLSPSFGVVNMNNREIKILKEAVHNLKKVSIREDEGADLIKKISGIDAKVLIDPTMALLPSEWMTIESKVYSIPQNYLATYFLSEPSIEMKKYINQIASVYNFEIVNIMDKSSIYYTSGPSEFIYIIRNASLVITDSFHGSVFSILFNIPFYVVDRKYGEINMNGRIETLLNKFDLKERYLLNFSNLNYKCDFSKANSILDKEREQFNTFLFESFNIHNEENINED